MNKLPPSQAASGTAVNFLPVISPVKFSGDFLLYDGDTQGLVALSPGRVFRPDTAHDKTGGICYENY